MSYKINMRGIALPQVLMIVLVVTIIGGTGYYVAIKQDSKQSDSRQNQDGANNELQADLTGLKSADEIRAIAKPAIGSAQIVSIQLEQEDVGPIYKVKLSDGKVLYFNAKTGASMTKAQAGDDGQEAADDKDAAAIPSGFVASISLEKAREIAQQKRPGKTISKVELEPEDGAVVYSVRFTDDGRVDVNATSGVVVRVKEPGSSSSGSGSGLHFDGGTGDEDLGSNSGSGSGSSGSDN